MYNNFYQYKGYFTDTKCYELVSILNRMNEYKELKNKIKFKLEYKKFIRDCERIIFYGDDKDRIELLKDLIMEFMYIYNIRRSKKSSYWSFYRAYTNIQSINYNLILNICFKEEKPTIRVHDILPVYRNIIYTLEYDYSSRNFVIFMEKDNKGFNISEENLKIPIVDDYLYKALHHLLDRISEEIDALYDIYRKE